MPSSTGSAAAVSPCRSAFADHVSLHGWVRVPQFCLTDVELHRNRLAVHLDSSLRRGKRLVPQQWAEPDELRDDMFACAPVVERSPCAREKVPLFTRRKGARVAVHALEVAPATVEPRFPDTLDRPLQNDVEEVVASVLASEADCAAVAVRFQGTRVVDVVVDVVIERLECVRPGGAVVASEDVDLHG